MTAMKSLSQWCTASPRTTFNDVQGLRCLCEGIKQFGEPRSVQTGEDGRPAFAGLVRQADQERCDVGLYGDAKAPRVAIR